MELDRIDLADIADPVRLAAALHRQLGHANGPVPMAEVAKALGILEVRQDALDGCEGVLLTDTVRSYGSILVNTRGGPRRTRFSIAHELGHFVNLHDEPMAAVVTHHGRVRYSARGPRFPWVRPYTGALLSEASLAYRAIAAGNQAVTIMEETLAAAWIADPDVEMFEQTSVEQGGHALTLLWATLPETDEEEEDAPEELGRPGSRKKTRRR